MTSIKAKSPTTRRSPPVLSLIFAKISKDFAGGIVNNVYQTYADRLLIPSDSPSRELNAKDRRGLAVITSNNAGRNTPFHDEPVEQMLNKAREICGVWKEASQVGEALV